MTRTCEIDVQTESAMLTSAEPSRFVWYEVHGPSVVPDAQQIAHCLDTQGAIFRMVGARRQ
jgi:hypothetical protein